MRKTSLQAAQPRPRITFECSACAAKRTGPDANIPVGWSQHACDIWCEDCTASGAYRAARLGKGAAA